MRKPLNSSSRGSVKSVLLWLLLLGLASVLVVWFFFLPKIVGSVIESRTGFHLKIDKLSCNPFAASLEISGLELTNPQTFPRSDFVKIRTIEAALPISSLWSDTFVVDRAVLDVEQVALIRSQNGENNAQLFADRLAGKSTDASAPASTSSSASKPFMIHRLEIRVGTVLVENHTSRDPLKKSFDLRFSQTWTDVSSVRQLLNVNVLKSLAPIATALNGKLPASISKAFESISAGGKGLFQLLGNEVFKSSGDALEQKQKP